MSWLFFTILIGALLMAGLLLSIKSGIYITGDLPNAQAGTYVYVTLTAVGIKYGATWTLIGELPPGLEEVSPLLPGDGPQLRLVFGTLTTPGDYTFSFNVVDGQGRSATREFHMKVTAADAMKVSDGVNAAGDGETLTTVDETAATVGETYSLILSPIGGVAPYTYTVLSGALVGGLTFTAATGEVTGTPTTESGFDVLDLRIADSSSQSIDFGLLVRASIFDIPISGVPDGTRGEAYEFQLYINNDAGAEPIIWSIIAGSLPDGIVLSAEGLLHGHPTVTASSQSFTVQADSAGGSTDTQVLAITIAAAVITVDQSLPDGEIAEPYHGVLTPSGGYGGYTAEVTVGSLPGGIDLLPSRAPSWVIVGTPFSPFDAGSNAFTVHFTDAFGNSVDVPCAITLVAQDLVFQLTFVDNTAEVGEYYYLRFTSHGGTASITASLLSGTLPPGLALQPHPHEWWIQGTPTTGGRYTFTIRLTDSASPPDTADHEFTIKVD